MDVKLYLQIALLLIQVFCGLISFNEKFKDDPTSFPRVISLIMPIFIIIVALL